MNTCDLSGRDGNFHSFFGSSRATSCRFLIASCDAFAGVAVIVRLAERDPGRQLHLASRDKSHEAAAARAEGGPQLEPAPLRPFAPRGVCVTSSSAIGLGDNKIRPARLKHAAATVIIAATITRANIK